MALVSEKRKHRYILQTVLLRNVIHGSHSSNAAFGIDGNNV